jgi:hypothetical protein
LYPGVDLREPAENPIEPALRLLIFRSKGPRPRARKLPSMQYYTVPILLVVMSLGLMGLIYWGATVEERRNRSRA